MAVATRAPLHLLAGALAAGALALLMLLLLLAALLGGEVDCGPGAADPSQAARRDIPADYLALMQSAERRYGVPWTVLAGVASVETNFGRSTAVGVRDGVNFAGCCAGPMQFNIRNGPPSTWERFRVDGNGDGRTDVYDPADAVPAAARLLKEAGAPGDLRRALLAYNNAGWYVDKVLAQARAYAEGGMSLVGPASAGVACAAEDAAGLLEGGQTGAWTLAPGANRPGVALTPLMRRFVDRMAGLVPGIVVTTGTNHSQFSSSGNVSDHWDGNGVDFGSVANGFPATGGGRGDLIAAAALVVAGRSPARALAEARRGGAITVTRPGLRVQVIWKSLVGGNHFNHVHVGLRPT